MSDATLFPRTKLIGWAVVAVGVYLVVAQVVSVIRKKHPLPDIRHKIYWSKNLYQQARLNRNEAVAAELASFYLIERVLADRDLAVAPKLEELRWNLEEVSRTHVTVSPDIEPIASEALKDVGKHALTGKINKRTLYVHVLPNITSYVFVPSVVDTEPLYIVPEYLYRSRAADKSGANLRAP